MNKKEYSGTALQSHQALRPSCNSLQKSPDFRSVVILAAPRTNGRFLFIQNVVAIY